MRRTMTIGALARRTGLPVKTLRFYSDEGLLPPAGRSRSGYRLFTEADAARVDVIRTLRDAGVPLADVARVLRHDTPVGELLRLHLHAVETHIAGLQRVAAAIRLAIDMGGTEQHLRRITMTMRESYEDRRRTIAAFYDEVARGLPVSRAWIDGMIDASVPASIDDATPERLAAWLELRDMLSDPALVASKRANAADAFAPRFDAGAFVDAHVVAMEAARDLHARGVAPSSPEAAAVVMRFAGDLAARTPGGDPAATAAHLRVKFDPRGARYWELVSVLRADATPLRFDEWRWIGQALEHHVRAA